MRVSFAQNRRNVMPESESALWLSVRIQSGETDRVVSSIGSSHYVLIDSSGSMSGEKIEAAKEALRRYVDLLTNNDDLTLIVFGRESGVEKLLLHEKMDAKGRGKLQQEVNSLEADDGTPLYGAVAEFVNLCRNASSKASLVLLTDGQATDLTDPTMYEETLKGVVELISRSYIIGIGLDYDEKILIAIKNATNGQFEHISSPNDVVGKFQEISAKNRNVVVQSPRMLIKLTKGVSLGGIYRVEPQIQELTSEVKTTDSGELEIIMPDLVADEGQQYVMMLIVPARPEGEYREGKVRFHGIDNPQYDIILGRTTVPAASSEIDPAPRLLYIQTRERWIAQKALQGDSSALAETQKILLTYQSNPEKMKTMPLSHIEDLKNVTKLLSAGDSADSKTKKQMTAKLTRKIEP